MAITPMRLVTLTGPVEQLDQALMVCMEAGAFQPLSAAQVLQDELDLYPVPSKANCDDAAETANRLAAQLGIDPARAADAPLPDALTAENTAAYFRDLDAQVSALVSEREALTTEKQTNADLSSRLSHFLSLSFDLSEFSNLSYMQCRFGRMPAAAFELFSRQAHHNDELAYYVTEQADGFVYLLCLSTARSAKRLNRQIDAMGFEAIDLTAQDNRTPKEIDDTLKSRQAAIDERLDAIAEHLQRITRNEERDFLSQFHAIRLLMAAQSLRQAAAQDSDEQFYLTGWMPKADAERFRCPFETELRDPSEVKRADPPVKLKNCLLGRIFEPFVEMYGLPAYNEIDPSLIMGILYTFLFGMMYGDFGQGILLIAFGLVLWKRKQMWLGRVLACVGCSAAVFGLIFGSFFGYEELYADLGLPYQGFHALHRTTETLLIAVAIGISIILLVMVLNILNGIRQKDPVKILFGPNGLAGLVFYVAVIAAGVCLLVFGRNILSLPYILGLIVLPLLLIFCREPLGKLLKHEKDWLPESIGGFIGENFFELFETLLSYVTNTVSFLRVGAYAISHAGMMMVVYMLAGGTSIPVIIIGNLVVMAIEGLLVCIQVLRLNFYEIFGRFYGSGGTEFQPHTIDYTNQTEL